MSTSERTVFVLKQGLTYLTRVPDISQAMRFPTVEAALEAAKPPLVIQASELTDTLGRLVTVIEVGPVANESRGA
jgi:hypothetical protein